MHTRRAIACRHCLGPDPPLGGGFGGETAAVLPGLKLGIPFFFLVLMWTIHMSESYHLISKLAGMDVVYSATTVLRHCPQRLRGSRMSGSA